MSKDEFDLTKLRDALTAILGPEPLASEAIADWRTHIMDDSHCKVCGGSGDIGVPEVVEVAEYGHDEKYAHVVQYPCVNCRGRGTVR